MTGPIIDPHAWLAAQEARIVALQARAEQAKQELSDAHTTVSSRGGAVTVTVNPGGALTALRLTAKADQLGHQALAAEIMTTIRQAQGRAGQRTAEIMAAVIGDDSEAMDFIKEQLPEQVEEDAPPPRRRPDDEGGDRPIMREDGW
ncbi:DNA-binding protein YbaB [Crossiella equi]|uniref:DNA-binding protein YbaB n=1 Tax=Crossiella equi TaxID=130796 RepID=A0ABS5AKE3_9PSEU|nr:YbaB/EbfC family nucleoid-associated protein [Crossiella equi]MBP2476125.1 DNA-binding protein YbaB [Crossiella equi]